MQGVGYHDAEEDFGDDILKTVAYSKRFANLDHPHVETGQ